MEGCPYRDLHIIELEGIPEDPKRYFGNHLLGMWVEEGFSFLFLTTFNSFKLEQFLKDQAGISLLDLHVIDYDAWQGGLRLSPVKVDKLVFYPYWIKYSPSDGETEIPFDPGLVFGSGQHPTTRHCLELLLGFSKENRLKSVIDLGTGTGILSLAAAALGATHVLAVDTNPLCVETALRNVIRNGWQGQIEVRRIPAQRVRPDHRVDLIMANLPPEVIFFLLEDSHFEEVNAWIISGLYRSSFQSAVSLLEKKGYRIFETREGESVWYTILAGLIDNI
nr:methyltransferase domain-containing protein [Desulfobacterales bacterium]